MSWTEERTEYAIKSWKEGVSASNIAKALNQEAGWNGPQITRNAVIGKLHRLGFCERHVPSLSASRKNMTPSTLVFRKPKNVRPPVKSEKPAGRVYSHPAPPCDADGVPLTVVSLFDAKRTQCRFPVRGTGADLEVCGFEVEGDGSICAHHGECCRRAPERKRKLRLDEKEYIERKRKRIVQREVRGGAWASGGARW